MVEMCSGPHQSQQTGGGGGGGYGWEGVRGAGEVVKNPRACVRPSVRPSSRSVRLFVVVVVPPGAQKKKAKERKQRGQQFTRLILPNVSVVRADLDQHPPRARSPPPSLSRSRSLRVSLRGSGAHPAGPGEQAAGRKCGAVGLD